MAATIPPPFEGIRTIQRPQAGVRDGENLRVFSPGHNIPGGGGGRKLFRREHGSPSALTEVFSRLVSVMYSKERKRFPEELFLPGFPTRDNLQTGTEDSSPPSHHPAPDRSGAFSFLN